MNTTAHDPGKPRTFQSPEEKAAWSAELDAIIDEIVLAVMGPRVSVELDAEELDAVLGAG